MTITSPPRPPRLSDPIDREELEALVNALIEEARQRTRRRRQKYAAFAVVASAVAVGITTILERSTGEQGPSLALAARSSVAQGASSTIAFITSGRTYCSDPPVCTRQPRDAFNGKLYVVNTDGSGLRLVAQKASPSASPAWSPDGQKLAFQGQRRGNRWNGGINVVNADGSGLQNLTSGFGPDWSPDGQKIAFVRTVRVRPVGVGAAMPDMEILVMNADGSEQQNLTRNLAVYADPVWSPDGQEIAFMSNRYDDCVLAGAICQELWVMNADGSGQQRLTRNAATDSDQSWSPDGTKIAFHRAVGPFRCGPRGCGPAESDIFVMNADGSGERNLTRNDPSNAMDADWSPDGRRIVFRTSRHGKWEVYVMNANGSGQRRLTRTPAANESSPSWSPDGRKIAFTREAGANFELYVMNADGSGQRRLTPNSPVDRWIAYSWSP
jgi:Tol biopolymer transport system component